MRLTLKILALPIAGVLTLVVSIFSFMLVILGVFLNFVTVVVALIGLLNIFTYDRTAGAIWLIIAFLISPYGLPKVAEWLVMRLNDVCSAIKGFILG